MSDKAYAVEARLNAHLAGSLAGVAIADVTTTGSKTLGVTDDIIPGGTIAGGEHHVCDAAGRITTGVTPPTTITFTMFYGTTGGVSIGALPVPAAGLTASLSGAGWNYHADIVWVSATEAAVSVQLDWHNNNGVANSSRFTDMYDTTGIDTSADKNLTLGFAFTGTPGTLKTFYSHFTRRR